MCRFLLPIYNQEIHLKIEPKSEATESETGLASPVEG